ncbi:prealbumin-like fold domain-containing protein [Eubacterium aggregans]|uniref:prealbumin-like fold domain-containing protein n=1 Tax=Eubacterium aggregans TaxID=81409 RepID=UPI003F39FD0C
MITLPAKSEPLYVEYQVKLGNVPADSKIGGKMILGDEGMTQTNVESQVEVSDPVCKIGIKYYYKLSSAVAAATDGSRIETLVGNLSLEEIKIQNKNLTITTASNTGELPYHGAEGSFGILSRTGGKGYLNLENSTVILENIILSENKDSGIAGSQAILKADQRSNLTLGSGVSVTGVVLLGTIADEAPVVLCGSSKMTMTDNAVISDCQSPKGGAVYMDDTSQFIMTGGNILKNKATIEGGGIYAEGGTGSTLELFGGNIKENTAPIAGGVAIKDSMLIQIKGCPFVTQNINAQGKYSNLSLPKGQSIRLMGMLDDTSVIGVTTTAEDHIIGHVIADASMAGETVLNQTIAKNTIQRIQDDWGKNLQIGQPKMDGSKVCFVKAPEFKLKNVIAEDSQKPLSGVVFKMYRLVDARTDLDSTKIARLRDDRNQLAVEKDIQDGYWQVQKYSINGQSVEELTTPADGILNLVELGNGDYMLVEKQTATGYQLPVGQWMISVDGSESDATDRIKITTRGSGLDRPLSITVKTTEESIEYSLRHVKSIVLPFAGFNGNRPNYQIVGLCLLTGISVVLAINKTKGGGVKK